MISDKRIAIKFLLVVLVCVFVSGDAKVRCRESEREALLSFKNGVFDYYGYLSSWRSIECCRWYGVWCSNTTGHVIALQLNIRLQGEVGSSLLELHHLNYLDLSWNDFGGNPFPDFIGSMKQLQQLFLRGCNFSGIVPPQLGNLTNLQSLDLGENNFEGPIPGFFCSMKQLQQLFLRGSKFTGIVPPQLGNLTNLRVLDISYNSLRIKNLDWLSSLSWLSTLDLSQINLSHTHWLPHILSLRFLNELRLDLCSISTIKVEPTVNSSSTSLSLLKLSDNQLTPSSLHWLSNISTTLVGIDLSRNALGGPIPDAFIEKLVHVETLGLASNKIEGQIPKSLFNLSRLSTLVLYENDLRGNIDELFGNTSGKGILESLQILDLAHNKLVTICCVIKNEICRLTARM